MMQWEAAWALAAKRHDPLLFATGVMGFPEPGQPADGNVHPLEPWHVKALSAIRDGEKRISIRSGHGCKKTTFLAICALFALLCCGDDVKVPIVAGSESQLTDTIWPEIAKWRERLPAALRDQIDVQKTRIVVKAAPANAFAVARTASKDNPDAMQGFHARRLWFLVDEATGVSEKAYEVAQGALSTPGAIFILAGNPTKNTGYFHATHTRLRERWCCIHVSSEDVPTARGHIEDVIATYGRNSNAYRVRVLGEFPTQDDETVIPLDKVMASIGRPVVISNVFPVWGVDPGRFGDDPSAVVGRQGNTLLSDVTREWHGLDGPQLGGRIIAMYNETPTDMKPREIAVDVIGIGCSAYDHMRLPGSPIRSIVTGVNVAEATAVSETEHRLRDELWFRGRAWFAQLDCCIQPLPHAPDRWKLIEKMIGELTGVTYDYTVLGKRIVESKKDMRKRSVPSPNIADAFLNTQACGIYPRENPHRRATTTASGSWMTA